MTLSARLFGYAISISFDKTIRVPIDKLSNEFAARTTHDGSEPQLQSNQAPVANAPHDALHEPLVQTVRY